MISTSQMTKAHIQRIKFLGIVIIAIWLIRPLLFRIIGIDFLTMEYARSYRLSWIVLLPISCLLVFYESWTRAKKIINRVLAFALIAVGSLVFVYIAVVATSICEWNLSSPLYENRFNESYISRRSLNCGAFDSDGKFKTVEVTPFLQYFYKYKNIQTHEPDPDKWVKLN
jgi:ACR3 family arsenite efflux pump ArsB